MNESGLQRILPDQSSGSGLTFGTVRHPSVTRPILSKRVCFYKSGDPQFNGLRLVINNRTFKTFDALLDSLSQKVPLPFGVRNITTPHGVHVINTLDELEDGKSYICSDSRKVKPINLALARKKLPPWYHATPASSRRRTVQQARMFPGRGVQKPAPVAVRTPKRLQVFRNGEPTVRHTVVLQKKNAPSYESILEYISKLMHFHVVKLYTPDGKRVEGLPGLILCSGTVVAAGRESFRPAVYSSLKSPPATKLHNGRQKFTNRKKKSLSNSSKSRNFSSSSERYIVRQIQNTIAGSSYGVPSNPTNSIELDSNRMLGSVAETEDEACLGDGGETQYCSLPNEDDIEKSFRVNQDGSMTVEMRVRLTIKEEETVHWTTTLSRSSATTCLPEPEPTEEICSPESNSLDLQNTVASSIDSVEKDKTKDDNDENPPSISNGALSESSQEEDDVKSHSDLMLPRRFPTPGLKQISKKQTSVESTKSVTPSGIQEELVGSYSYREQTENGEMTEEYCVVKQSSSRPVPKPRRLGSVDCSNSRYLSEFKSAGMSEVLQVESNGDEVTETVLHIYEQQTFQDNYLANVCAHGMSPPQSTFERPATSDTGKTSCNNEFEVALCRPSTASESISIWRAGNTSETSDFNSVSLNTRANNTTTRRPQPLQKIIKGQVKSHPGEASNDKRASTKHKATNKHVRWIRTPGKRQKKKSAEAPESQKKMPTFSSSRFLKGIYGNKSTLSKSGKNIRKRPKQNGNASVTTNSLSDDAIKSTRNKPTASKDRRKQRVSFELSRTSLSSPEVNHPRGVLTRQTSMHMEKKSEKNHSHDNNASVSLPAFNCASSSTNEYVENWLEKARLDQQAESCRWSDSGNKQDLIAQAEECNVETSKLEICQTSEPQAENVGRTSVKLKIQCFENNSESSPVGKTKVSEDIINNRTTYFNKDSSKSPLQADTEDTKPLMNKLCSEISPENPTERPLQTEMENKPSSVKISFQKATPCSTLSMELPPPPSAAEIAELSNSDGLTKEASVGSSPLYRLSSSGSPKTDAHSLSDEVVSPTETATEIASSVQAEAALLRTPSIKRAPLVSNLSLERKMSLRKANMDKHTLGSDSPSKKDIISPTVNTAGDDVLLNAICSSEMQNPTGTFPEDTRHSFSDLTSGRSRYSSVSPTSLTSEERESSVIISSSEASGPSNLPLKETNPPKVSSSPKTSVKKVKLMSSPSPERKGLNKKYSVELPNNSPKLSSKNPSPDVGLQRLATSSVSPSAERRHKLQKPKQQKRLSPYSQSLDVASPLVRHNSGKKSLLRNPSLEGKVLSPRKNISFGKATAGLDQTLVEDPCLPLEADQRESICDPTNAVLQNSMTDVQMQEAAHPINAPNQLNMKPVLDQICYSIKSIRHMTQSKRPSCLKKSNSLPDFSSHVASTFGSSSKVLLAFLSVMTLKEGMTNLNMNELNANNVSCAEALKLIDSLTEIANIEDSHKLKTCLSDLQQSASKQLLQSWKDFQELSGRCKSRSTTANSSEREFVTADNPDQDCNIEDNGIDELMDSFDIPEKLKEELVALSEGTKSDNETKMSGKMNEPVESNNEKHTKQLVTDTVTNDPQNDPTNVNVRSIIEKFTHINQPKQAGTASEPSRCKPVVESTKDPQCEKSNVIKCLLEEEIPKDRQDYSTPTVRENGETLQPCNYVAYKDIVEEETQQNNARVTQQSTDMKREISSETNLEEERVHSETEKQELDRRQLQPASHNESKMSDNEFSHDESSSDKVVLMKEVLSQKESEEQSASTPDKEDRNSLEEEDVPVGEIKEESSKDKDLSNPESPSEEDDEDVELRPSYYVELNVREEKDVSCSNSENQVLSEEKQPEVEHNGQCERSEGETQRSNMGLNLSVEESTENSDEDETASEEEQLEVELKQLQAIEEETLSGIEEEEEEEEVEHVYVHPQDRDQTTKTNRLEALPEEAEEDHVSSEEADKTHSYERKNNNSTVCEDWSKFIKKEDTYIINDSVAKIYRFITDDDSGNDQGSCEEHEEEDQSKPEVEHVSCSLEEELSYYDKDFSSEEEKANMRSQGGRTIEALSDVINSEIALEKEITTQSVAARVILLERQVAASQKRKYATISSAAGGESQTNAPPESDASGSSSESPTSQLALCTRSAPQSSLSFSYDSSGVITMEPEGSRVRSIRQMFLVKSATDVQQKHVPSSSASSERLDFRAASSVSGGYLSQTSSEPTSGEDDSARTSITKGFVRRTIERLYGKKDAHSDEEAGGRPPSVQKQKNKEQSSFISSLQSARSKAMSELSYFNSTSALDTLTEATRCIAFNAQVGPGDSVPVDDGRWFLRDNTLIRKSISDPVGINKAFTNTPEADEVCKDTEDHSPYSGFTTKSELEDKAKSFSRKCTYFSLPHGSDSDACQDEVTKGGPNDDSVVEIKDVSGDAKTWAERNGKLPGVGIIDFKMGDNKVHPLTEAPPDAEVVVVQPGKGQGVVNRRLPEPDMLDFLYNFCGQNCPIL